jgi:hypothetical protein
VNTNHRRSGGMKSFDYRSWPGQFLGVRDHQRSS